MAGSGYVLHLLKHWRSPKEDVGKVICAVVTWTQYQARPSYPIFTKTDTNINYVDRYFCPATRQFLKEIQGAVWLDPTYVQPPLREKDKAIMDNEKVLSVFTEKQRRRINSVRMYLGVTWLSEICTIDGTSLVEGIGDDVVELLHENTLTKPAQNKPNTRSWALWDRLLKTFTIPNESTLKESLGDWHQNHSRYRRWNTYQENSNTVYT